MSRKLTDSFGPSQIPSVAGSSPGRSQDLFLFQGPFLVLVSGCGCSVALSHGRPGGGQPGDGALELGVADAHVAQAGVVHGGLRGHRQRGGQARVGGAPQELGRQSSGDGPRGRPRGGEGGARHRPQVGVLTVGESGRRLVRRSGDPGAGSGRFLPGVGGGVGAVGQGAHPAGVGDLERRPAVMGRKSPRAVVHVVT